MPPARSWSSDEHLADADARPVDAGTGRTVTTRSPTDTDSDGTVARAGSAGTERPATRRTSLTSRPDNRPAGQPGRTAEGHTSADTSSSDGITTQAMR